MSFVDGLTRSVGIVSGVRTAKSVQFSVTPPTQTSLLRHSSSTSIASRFPRQLARRKIQFKRLPECLGGYYQLLRTAFLLDLRACAGMRGIVGESGEEDSRQ